MTTGDLTPVGAHGDVVPSDGIDSGDVRAPGHRMPAEWEPHRATWIAWPHLEEDWPGKFGAIPWVYAEIVRVLHAGETVEILCQDDGVRQDARTHLEAHGCRPDGYRLHVCPTDRGWLRDSGPAAVRDAAGELALVNWRFNGWAKYDNFSRDALVGAAVARLTGRRRLVPMRPDDGTPIVLEGGAFDTNGAGLLLTTEECLLSDVQQRNPGLSREDYEEVFRYWLGSEQVIWLGEGCVGDDTHGHVDDIARFVDADTVLLAFEEDPADENHARSIDNLRRLTLAAGGGLRVVPLPYPRPVVMDGVRLPASYANFYIANGVVAVPTFNDPKDRVALDLIARELPDRTVVGIHAVDLVWGLGTLHCLTQQEPAALVHAE
jgi:agmatine deiminase